MRPKRTPQYRATVKVSEAGSGLTFMDYCASREEAIFFCLTQRRKFPQRATSAWVDQLMPEPQLGIWIAGRDPDWEIIERRAWSPGLTARSLFAVGIIVAAELARGASYGASDGSSLWLLAVAVITCAALWGVGAGLISVIAATLLTDFFDIPPVDSFN